MRDDLQFGDDGCLRWRRVYQIRNVEYSRCSAASTLRETKRKEEHEYRDDRIVHGSAGHL